MTSKERRQALRRIELLQFKRENAAVSSIDPSSIPVVWLALPGALIAGVLLAIPVWYACSQVPVLESWASLNAGFIFLVAWAAIAALLKDRPKHRTHVHLLDQQLLAYEPLNIAAYRDLQATARHGQLSSDALGRWLRRERTALLKSEQGDFKVIPPSPHVLQFVNRVIEDDQR